MAFRALVLILVNLNGPYLQMIDWLSKDGKVHKRIGSELPVTKIGKAKEGASSESKSFCFRMLTGEGCRDIQCLAGDWK